MKTAGKVLLFSLVVSPLLAQRPWQQITVPSLSEVAANFKTPPREYGAIQPFANWNGPDGKARRAADFDRLAANGMFIVNLSPGRGEPKYLSPEHMDLVKFAVQEAARRRMKLWLQDESDYPSGFAGGKISEQYPELTMQGLDADMRINVMPGQTLTMPAPPGTLGALAVFAPLTRRARSKPYQSGRAKSIGGLRRPGLPAIRANCRHLLVPGHQGPQQSRRTLSVLC
jgi:hypothetical protein